MGRQTDFNPCQLYKTGNRNLATLTESMTTQCLSVDIKADNAIVG